MRDSLIALSLANVFFLRAWEKALASSFLFDFKPDRMAIALLVLASSALLLLGWRLVRKSKRLAFAAKLLFLFSLVLPLNALRLYYQQQIMALYGSRYHLVAGLIIVLLLAPVVFALFRRRNSFDFLVRYGMFLVLALAPFAVFTLGATARDAYVKFRSGKSAGLAPTTEKGSGEAINGRVVWIVFDELEERTAFSNRPATVVMPELDRLRAESFVAAAAFPPAGGTIQSVPSLLDGQRVSVVGLRRESLEISDAGQIQLWQPSMTVFAEVAAAGKHSGVAAVFLPYCATHGSLLARCDDFQTARANEPLWRKMTRALTIAMDAVPLAFRLYLHRQMYQNEIERYQFASESAKVLSADRNLDLVFLHLPLPHPPGIYDRANGHLTAGQQHSYLDNLVLTDLTFGSLRRAMEYAGVWQDTTVIVTGDHWWRVEEVWKAAPNWSPEEQEITAGRPPDHRVPFIIKLAGNQTPLVYQRRVNTLVTRRLVMELLHERIKTVSDLTQLIESSKESDQAVAP